MTEASTPGATDLVLRAQNLHKQFGRTVALHDVSMLVRRGEVHALLGHNGSGKSTLVKIISGVLSPDHGSVSIDGHGGRPATIGVVHQDLGLCYDATVIENTCMSRYEPRRLGTIDWKAERKVVEPILRSLDADFSSSAMVRDLSPANQAIVAIARALKAAPTDHTLDLLILDEATARLRGRDADKVLATAGLVARRGGGVLIVTHHMSEVLRAADCATVLMNGRVAGVVQVADSSEEQLLELASGRRVSSSKNPSERSTRLPSSSTNAPLRVSKIRGERFECDAEIVIQSGEIVGMTGAPGAGHEEIPYLIAGMIPGGRADVAVLGRPVKHKGAHESRRAGIGLVPAERLQQGVMLQASVRENLSPLVRPQSLWARLLSRSREQAWARQVCAAFQVSTSDTEMPMATLSGGNQQKVLLARVLEDRPKVLLLHEPTEGVDEMTRRDLVERIRTVARAGTAVLYVSSDIDEVAEYADRVLVVRDGALIGEFARAPDIANRVYAASYLTS